MKPIRKTTKITIELLLCALKDLEYRYRDSGCMPRNKKYIPMELKNAWKILDNAKNQIHLSEDVIRYIR